MLGYKYVANVKLLLTFCCFKAFLYVRPKCQGSPLNSSSRKYKNFADHFRVFPWFIMWLPFDFIMLFSMRNCDLQMCSLQNPLAVTSNNNVPRSQPIDVLRSNYSRNATNIGSLSPPTVSFLLASV